VAEPPHRGWLTKPFCLGVYPRIKKIWSVYPRCLDINSQNKNIYKKSKNGINKKKKKMVRLFIRQSKNIANLLN
jgi:hypothetical protein